MAHLLRKTHCVRYFCLSIQVQAAEMRISNVLMQKLMRAMEALDSRGSIHMVPHDVRI